MQNTAFYRIISLVTIILITASSPAFSKPDANPDDPDFLYSKAMTLKSENKLTEAIALLTSLAEKGSQLDRIYFQIALCHQKALNFTQAQLFARKSISQNPKYSDPYQLVYEISMTLKNHEDAADILEELLVEKPDLIHFQYSLGLLYFQNMQNSNLATASFKKVISIAHRIAAPPVYREQSNLILSDIAYSQKDYKKSVEYLTEAVKINPANNPRFYRYATTFITNNMLNLARICIEQFLSNITVQQKLNPVVKNIYAYLGGIYYILDHPQANYYLRLGSGEESIENYISKQLFLLSTNKHAEAEKALEKISASEYSNYAAPHIALARIKKLSNDEEGAFKSYVTAGNILAKTDLLNSAAFCFIKAHQLKPSEQNPILSLAQTYEQLGNMRLAALYFNKFNESWPDIEIVLHLSYLYDLVGDQKKSSNNLAEAAKTNPSYARIYFIKGLIESKHDKYSESELSIKHAISLKADDHNYYYYLAISQEKTGKNSEAVTSLQKAIEMDKQNASYQNFLGYLFTDMNINLDKAQELLNSAIKQDPYNGAYLDSIGWLYYRQGKYDIAMKKLLQAARNLEAINEADPVVYDHIGDTYDKLGNTNKAIAYWKLSVNKKNSPEIIEKIKIAESKK